MVRNKGCLCWPVVPSSKRKDCAIISASSSSGVTKKLPEKSLEDEDCAAKAALQSIPKEHDEFLEMLFPAGRHRSRTLTTSIPSSERRHRNEGSSWFRDRASSVISGKRYPMGNDLLLLDMVPTTPVSFSRECSATLPFGHRGFMEPELIKGQRDDWPEYMWRLNQKKQQKCHCSGCEETCTRFYKYPVQHHLGPFFDNESYYNTHDILKVRWGDTDHWIPQYDRPISRKSMLTKSNSYDVPITQHGSVLFNRHAHQDPLCDPYSRSSVILDSQAKPPRAYFQSSTNERVQASTEDSFENEAISDCSVCRCSCQQHNRPNWKIDNISFVPNRYTKQNQGCLKERSKFGRRCFACELKFEARIEDRGKMKATCNADRFQGRNLDVDDDESNYVQSDVEGPPVGLVVNGSSDASSSLVPELNCIVPSHLKYSGSQNICVQDKDCSSADCEYLMPFASGRKSIHSDESVDSSSSERCKNGRYLPMNISTQLGCWKEGEFQKSAEQEQKEKVIRNNTNEGEKNTEKDEEEKATVNQQLNGEETSSRSYEGNDREEKKDHTVALDDCLPSKSTFSQYESECSEAKMKSPPDVQLASVQNEVPDILKLVETPNTDEIDATLFGQKSTKLGDDARMLKNNEPSGVTEVVDMSVESRDTPPPLVLRSRSQLDLLLMSPPPQCSYMLNHSYMNVSNTGGKKTTKSFRQDDDVIQDLCAKKQPEVPCARESYPYSKQQKLRGIKHSSIEEMTSSRHTLADCPSLQDFKCKQPASPYVMLYNKTLSGNEYCHTYLPTLNENLSHTCKTN